MTSNKVDFMIIGAQKCGTTSLAEQLASHPDVDFCAEKEPEYFSKVKDPFNQSTLNEYHALYQGEPNNMRGEASTSYFFTNEYPETPERLFKYNPDLKLILLLRDPVSRVVSHLYHRMRKGLVPNGDMALALETSNDYIERSLYAKQLNHYLKVFPKEQIHIMIFEDYVPNQAGHLVDVMNFLGLDPLTLPDSSSSTEAKNISDAKTRLQHIPLAVPLLTWIEKQPWAWRVTPHIPLKTSVPSSLRAYVWETLKSDAANFSRETGLDIRCWVDKNEHH
jgi:hypothetical protein